MAVGDNVRRLRERSALSQEELGKAAGLSPNTVWRVESGLGGAPFGSTLRKLAVALQVDVRELTEGPATTGTAPLTKSE
ncbi:MAG: helix-turn-helix domain-containing protein [Solirubrobacteraceae bacterium]